MDMIRKYKKIIIGVLFLLIFISAIIFAYKTCIEDVAGESKTIEYSMEAIEPIGEILGETTVRQTFSCDEKMIGISIRFATYARNNTGDISIIIQRKNSKEIEKFNLKCGEIADNYFCDFYFNNKALEKGEYEVIIKSENGTPGNAITLWKDVKDAYPGDLFVNGIIQTGDINLRLIQESHSFLYKYYGIITVLLLITGVSAYYLLIFRKFQIEKVAIILILLLGIIYILIIPPYAGPDIKTHYNMAYSLSNNFPSMSSNKAVEFRARDMDDRGYTAHIANLRGYKTIYNDLSIPNSESDNQIESMEFQASYALNPHLYFMSSLGIKLSRMFGFSSLWLYFTGAFFNLMTFAILTYYGIKKIPICKSTLFIIAILPMTIQQAASYSSDSILNGIAFCFVGMCLHYIFIPDSHIGWKEVVILGALTIFLVTGKSVYFPLAFFLLMIPKKRYLTIKLRNIAAIAVIILGGVYYIATNLESFADIVNNSVKFVWSDIPYYDFDFVISHPFKVLAILATTLVKTAEFYITTLVGGWMAGLSLPISNLIIYTFIFLLILSTVNLESNCIVISFKQKIVIAACTGSIIALTLLGMLLMFTPVGSSVVQGVQGRYFTPIALPLMLLCVNRIVVCKQNIERQIVFLALFLQIITAINVFIVACRT